MGYWRGECVFGGGIIGFYNLDNSDGCRILEIDLVIGSYIFK